MANERTPERSTGPPEVVVISITAVEPPPVRGRRIGGRLAGIKMGHGARMALAIVLVFGALGAIVAATGRTTRTGRSTGARRAQVQGGERAAIAAALGYPYPLRCLTITIFAGTPNYARTEVDRTNGCGRFHGYLNASLDRVDGAWRLVLDEGQLFVPNSLLTPCRPGRAGCPRKPDSGPQG